MMTNDELELERLAKLEEIVKRWARAHTEETDWHEVAAADRAMEDAACELLKSDDT